MNIFVVSVFAVAMIGVMVPSASAELTDSDISIVLNEKYFSHKMILSVDGQISIDQSTNPSGTIAIRIMDDDGNVVKLGNTPAGHTFGHDFILKDSFMEKSGTYYIWASYNGISAETSFEYANGTDSITSIKKN